MTRLIRILALLAVMVPAIAFAQGGTLRVTAERTSVRDRAATDGAVVASVARGDTLTILETSGPWFKVRTAAGREGYVHSLFVEREGSAAPTPAATAAPAPAPSPAPAPREPEPAAASSSQGVGGGSGTSAGAEFGVGLSILDGSGIGAIGDYFKPIKEQGSGVLGWTVNASIHHRGYDSFGADYSVNHILAGGGVRYVATINEKMSWHAQGTVGIIRSSFSYSDDYLDDYCNTFNVCSASDTGIVVTPGGGFTYSMNESRAVRGQIDFPIGEGGSTTRFSAMFVLKLGQ